MWVMLLSSVAPPSCCSFVRFFVHRASSRVQWQIQSRLARQVAAGSGTGQYCEVWIAIIYHLCVSAVSLMRSRLRRRLMTGNEGDSHLAATSGSRPSSLGGGAWQRDRHTCSLRCRLLRTCAPPATGISPCASAARSLRPLRPPAGGSALTGWTADTHSTLLI